MVIKVDLNSDLGEHFGAWSTGDDAAVMKYVTSANIACGFHAGDPTIMGKTVKLAVKNNVMLGAHPGYPDLLGFGRRKMDITKHYMKKHKLNYRRLRRYYNGYSKQNI